MTERDVVHLTIHRAQGLVGPLEHGRTREKEISKLIKLPNAALTWQNERKLLRAMVDQVPDYLFVKDLDCRFIIANEAIARIHGFDTTDEVIGMTDFDLHDAVTAKKFYEIEQGVIQSQRSIIDMEELVVDAATGREKWLLKLREVKRARHRPPRR